MLFALLATARGAAEPAAFCWFVPVGEVCSQRGFVIRHGLPDLALRVATGAGQVFLRIAEFVFIQRLLRLLKIELLGKLVFPRTSSARDLAGQESDLALIPDIAGLKVTDALLKLLRPLTERRWMSSGIAQGNCEREIHFAIRETDRRSSYALLPGGACQSTELHGGVEGVLIDCRRGGSAALPTRTAPSQRCVGRQRPGEHPAGHCRSEQH